MLRYKHSPDRICLVLNPAPKAEYLSVPVFEKFDYCAPESRRATFSVSESDFSCVQAVPELCKSESAKSLFKFSLSESLPVLTSDSMSFSAMERTGSTDSQCFTFDKGGADDFTAHVHHTASFQIQHPEFCVSSVPSDALESVNFTYPVSSSGVESVPESFEQVSAKSIVPLLNFVPSVSSSLPNFNLTSLPSVQSRPVPCSTIGAEYFSIAAPKEFDHHISVESEKIMLLEPSPNVSLVENFVESFESKSAKSAVLLSDYLPSESLPYFNLDSISFPSMSLHEIPEIMIFLSTECDSESSSDKFLTVRIEPEIESLPAEIVPESTKIDMVSMPSIPVAHTAQAAKFSYAYHCFNLLLSSMMTDCVYCLCVFQVFHSYIVAQVPRIYHWMFGGVFMILHFIFLQHLVPFPTSECFKLCLSTCRLLLLV